MIWAIQRHPPRFQSLFVPTSQACGLKNHSFLRPIWPWPRGSLAWHIGRNQWYHFGPGIGMFTGGTIWLLTHGHMLLYSQRHSWSALHPASERAGAGPSVRAQHTKGMGHSASRGHLCLKSLGFPVALACMYLTLTLHLSANPHFFGESAWLTDHWQVSQSASTQSSEPFYPPDVWISLSGQWTYLD